MLEFEAFKQTDASKCDYIQRLLSRISLLEQTNLQADAELQQLKETNQLFYKDMTQKRDKLAVVENNISQSSYVLVILDGDVMLFHDSFWERGFEGGKDAGRALKTEVEEYIEVNRLPKRSVVNIYANVAGLKKLYPGVDVYGFIQGFNMFDGGYHIIDAGNGKECSDAKVKRLFELSVDNLHCKHIIFGASADNGYARLLEAYAGREDITLLEGPPFGRELVPIAARSQTTVFDSVFRKTKKQLEQSPMEMKLTLNTVQRGPPGLPSTPITKTDTAPLTYAARATHAAKLLTPDSEYKSSSRGEDDDNKNNNKTSINKWNSGFPIHLNIHGERVDEPLAMDPRDISEVKGKKLCNNYHLFNNCMKTEAECVHHHGPKLRDRYRQAQRVLARSTACFQGGDCRSFWCTNGHQCYFGSKCRKGSECLFEHPSDTEIDETITA